MSEDPKPYNNRKFDFRSPPEMEHRHEFALAEYNRLCSEIEHYLKESSACVTYAIASSAAVWAWIGTNPQWNSRLVIWLPVVLNIFLAVRWFLLQRAFGVIGKYLQKTEYLYFNKDHGWESTVQWGKGGHRKRLWHLGTWGIFFFGGLLCLSGYAVRAIEPNPATQNAGEVVKAIDKLSEALKALKKQLANPPSNGSLNASPSPPAKSAASSTTPTSELPKP